MTAALLLSLAPLRAGGHASEAVVIAAGDVADCRARTSPTDNGASVTAQLVDKLPGTVLVLGDLVYGSKMDFESCYGPSWGRFKSRTRPAAGNHEYRTAGAAPYFAYFGSTAAPSGKSYYSFDLGSWHLVALDSNMFASDPKNEPELQPGAEEQLDWLRTDLKANRSACTLAYFHHPRFSSGGDGDIAEMAPVWKLLYEHGVDVVLAGHHHFYERFAPQNPEGAADPERGVREFIVGTGGADLSKIRQRGPAVEVLDNRTHGVLKLRLQENGYAWEFIPAARSSVDGAEESQESLFHDAGSENCHRRKS